MKQHKCDLDHSQTKFKWQTNPWRALKSRIQKFIGLIFIFTY
jgi:hypothetical protein